jgi:hypothetical protein
LADVALKETFYYPPKTYGEDIIEDVFYTIENDSDYHRRFTHLGKALSPKVVNTWTGKYTKIISGYRTLQERVTAKRSNLTTAYTKLIPKSRFTILMDYPGCR